MSVTEFQRHQVFQWLEEAMGPERAAVMMDLLPPVGWGDIATSADIAVVRTELRGELAELRGELAELRGEVLAAEGRLQRHIWLAVLTSNVSIAGLVLAALQLT